MSLMKNVCLVPLMKMMAWWKNRFSTPKKNHDIDEDHKINIGDYQYKTKLTIIDKNQPKSTEINQNQPKKGSKSSKINLDSIQIQESYILPHMLIPP